MLGSCPERREVLESARVRRFSEWLVSLFDTKLYPWFRDEFIHPREFAELYRGAPLSNPFEGFGPPIGAELARLPLPADSA